MARRDIGHASRNNTHASPWAETPARPSSRPEPLPGTWSDEPQPRPQWPEGSWWSEQPDGTERGRRSSRRGPSRREMKRHEARAKRSRKRTEDQFGARNRPPRDRDDRPRDDGSDARTRQFDARNGRPEARTRQFGPRNDPPDARTRQFGPRNDPPDARTRQFDARNDPPDARTRQFDARNGRSDERTRQFGPRNVPPDARTRQFDARAERFDARAERSDPRTERFDARTEGFGTGGRDRSREFQPRGGRSRRTERSRSQRRVEERPPQRAARSRQPAGPPSRRPATPRPGPKATPRRGRRPTDRMSIGAIVLSTAVGLSLLGIAERALLEGGPIGGTSGPAGSQRAITPPKPGGDPAQPPQPGQPQQPGQSGAPAAPSPPNLGVLAAQVRELTIDERGAAARQAYGAPPAGRPIVDATRTSPDKSWVFGTTALPVPTGSTATPEVAFYAARWTGEEWQVALSGGTEFNALLGAAPAKVMPAAEVRALRRYGALTAAQATALVNGSRAGDGLMLPWKTGEVWSMTTSDDSPRPLGSLAFSGGDGRVLAAGDGRLYRFCADSAGGAMVMLVHGSGVATTYYRLRGASAVRDGGVVGQGDPLGRIGTERPCGGAAPPRAEVGFGLRRGGGPIPLDGAQIGGWTFRERANPLLGFAERGVLQVLPGGLLANLGAVPAADDPPSSRPSPGARPENGAGSPPAPAAGATKKRSPSGANSQQ
ncbi:peptidoglycan DD-metalloendopeptidase family protein [Spirillospora sp. NPDC048819]|uniref:peptidoglycan DD-metalloendopeptidase family protein n=1 Tax=Spirillospora sp. NPDC048819 TaxID=3155268 RepID=UPI0033C56AAE